MTILIMSPTIVNKNVTFQFAHEFEQSYETLVPSVSSWSKNIWCFGCGQVGHRWAQCDRPSICLYCDSANRVSNKCPGAFPSFNHQGPSSGSQTSSTPPTPSSHLSPTATPKQPHPQSPPIPPKCPRTTKETPQPSTSSAEAPASQGGPSLQDLLKGSFGIPVVEQHRPPGGLRLTAVLRGKSGCLRKSQ